MKSFFFERENVQGMAKLPDETEERISALEESLTKLEEEIGPLLITPWEQLTRFGTSLASQ